jgi:glycine dehydrogenase subunit 2
VKDSQDFGAKLAFDRGAPGRRAVTIEAGADAEQQLPPEHLLRGELRLPELSQPELVRYYIALSTMNYGVDRGLYPLGSCTMKYNPKVHDTLASLPGFADIHPLAPVEHVQGALHLMWELQEALAAISGLPAVSLAPAAGAQGELAGMLMIKHLLEDRGELPRRRRVLVPDSAHGTNPASAAMAGFESVPIASDPTGSLDLAQLRANLDDSVAALMITLPSTLGLWEQTLDETIRAVHEAGAFVYGDGANLNALAGRLRFGDVGFDVVHLNLHKTFSSPHGGGGPGSGPVCSTPRLGPYLPAPVVEMHDDTFAFARPERSIGRLQQFHGSFAVLVRAFAYIRSLGLEGLRDISANAVLNANYLRALLHGHYDLPYDRPVMHEVVFSGSRQKREHGVRTYDIAKRLIDLGFHPPTIYFPLIVQEALMIEPTEAESAESIEAFVQAMLTIAREAKDDPEVLHSAPHTSPVGRLDEASAARHPDLRWLPPASEATPPAT